MYYKWNLFIGDNMHLMHTLKPTLSFCYKFLIACWNKQRESKNPVEY